MFKKQKVPARKKVYCRKNPRPYIMHKDVYWADKELDGLCQKLDRDDFVVFTCKYCKKLHVGRTDDIDPGLILQ